MMGSYSMESRTSASSCRPVRTCKVFEKSEDAHASDLVLQDTNLFYLLMQEDCDDRMRFFICKEQVDSASCARRFVTYYEAGNVCE